MAENIPAQPGGATAGGLKDERLGLGDRLSLINLIDEGIRSGSPGSPIMADLFNDLWDLVNRTVSGSRVDRLRAQDSENGFRVFEINAETGENLGRLTTIYLRKPIPCYYLVFVEVAEPFRRKGLGNRILQVFREFLVEKSAIGILDNVIPEEDPTYTIYFKHAWEPVEAVIGEGAMDLGHNAMIYVPPAFQGKRIREQVLKVLYHLERKRVSIEIRDNQMMVQRTIAEFKDLCGALLTYFDKRIRDAEASPLMRFMFTRFVTKFIAFRRRISGLMGYTGGDSLEQIALPPEITHLVAKSYAPAAGLQDNPFSVTGDRAVWMRLPEEIKGDPARMIETLPNYRRPSFLAWLKNRNKAPDEPLTIGDLLDLGFDPTRLKEIIIDGKIHIFERIQARQLKELSVKTERLRRIASCMKGARVKGALVLANPPLLEIRDRGNAYVLRPRVEGIHWEEALEQLHTDPALGKINGALRLDRMIAATVKEAFKRIGEELGEPTEILSDSPLACFVSWDLTANRPGLVIDCALTSLERIWFA